MFFLFVWGVYLFIINFEESENFCVGYSDVLRYCFVLFLMVMYGEYIEI